MKVIVLTRGGLVQDLTSDRVDATIDLADSYSINRPFNGFATCDRVGYDDNTKTATFVISITERGNKKMQVIKSLSPLD